MPSDKHRFREGPWTKIGALAGIAGVVLTLYGLGVFSGAGAPGLTHKPGPKKRESAQYLDSLQQTESTSNVVTSGETDVSARRFPHGVTIASLGATSSGSPNGTKFALPGQFATFRALLGVDPNSSPGFSGSMGVTIANEGHVFTTTVVSRGSPPCSINVPIDRAGTLELQVYPKSGEPLAVAFGDARVLGKKDFAGMPSGPPCS